MQLELSFARGQRGDEHWLRVGARQVRVHFVRYRRARRYVLRLCRDGAARVTIPRGGSTDEAQRFARSHISWLERQLVRQATQPKGPLAWQFGTRVLFRGELVSLQPAPDGVWLNNEVFRLVDDALDLRPAIERELWRLASNELPPRVFELAALHGFMVKRVTVRNQRSRWGSCSRRGTISLNWRLVQAAPFVRDYIIWHELAHLKEMNHSARFWREVRRLCPDYERAEAWLKAHASLLSGRCH